MSISYLSGTLIRVCGRYALAGDWSEFTKEFELEETPSLPQRYNIAPSASPGYEAPILTSQGLSQARFWYIPSFWSQPLKGLPTSFNARSETVHQKPFFRGARRCLVPTSGWREFPGKPGEKRAFHFHRGRAFFAMAGISSNWIEPESGEQIASFAILTLEPNDLVKPHHHRMPLLVARQDYGDWLAPRGDWDSLLERARRDSLRGELAAYECSTFGNSTKNDGPECVAPLDGSATPEQRSLF